MKQCPRCKALLPETEFGKEKHRPDGLRFYCKTCRRDMERGREQYWPSHIRSERRKQRLNTLRKFGEEHAKTSKRERDARYRASNKKKCLARSAAYRICQSPDLCSIPGCTTIGQRHHLSYDDPAAFVWLCVEHHLDVHNGRIELD